MEKESQSGQVFSDCVIILVVSVQHQQDHDGLLIKSKVDRLITGESNFFCKKCLPQQLCLRLSSDFSFITHFVELETSPWLQHVSVDMFFTKTALKVFEKYFQLAEKISSCSQTASSWLQHVSVDMYFTKTALKLFEKYFQLIEKISSCSLTASSWLQHVSVDMFFTTVANLEVTIEISDALSPRELPVPQYYHVRARRFFSAMLIIIYSQRRLSAKRKITFTHHFS